MSQPLSPKPPNRKVKPPGAATGTGFAIGARRLLTNHHVVDSATSLRVSRHGVPGNYEARSDESRARQARRRHGCPRPTFWLRARPRRSRAPPSPLPPALSHSLFASVASFLSCPGARALRVGDLRPRARHSRRRRVLARHAADALPGRRARPRRHGRRRRLPARRAVRHAHTRRRLQRTPQGHPQCSWLINRAVAVVARRPPRVARARRQEGPFALTHRQHHRRRRYKPPRVAPRSSSFCATIVLVVTTALCRSRSRVADGGGGGSVASSTPPALPPAPSSSLKRPPPSHRHHRPL